MFKVGDTVRHIEDDNVDPRQGRIYHIEYGFAFVKWNPYDGEDEEFLIEEFKDLVIFDSMKGVCLFSERKDDTQKPKSFWQWLLTFFK